MQTINFIQKVISKSDVFHPGQGGGLAEPLFPVNKPFPPVNKSRGSGGLVAARFLLGPQLINIPGGGGGHTLLTGGGDYVLTKIQLI